MGDMESLMPLARYLGDQLAIGRSVTDVAQELRDDASLPGRAYPAKFRASLAKQLLAQDKIRRKMGCAFRPSLVFKLDRVNQDGEWEVVNSQVVQASTEKEARHLASLKAGQEGKETWLNPRLSTCGRLPDGGGPRVIVDKYVS